MLHEQERSFKNVVPEQWILWMEAPEILAAYQIDPTLDSPVEAATDFVGWLDAQSPYLDPRMPLPQSELALRHVKFPKFRGVVDK